jgi:hypothetical protein
VNRLVCRVMLAVVGMAVLGNTAPLAGAQTRRTVFTLNDVMQAPFASDILAAPTGKLVPVALSTFLLNEEIGRDPVPVSPEVTLIQAVNTASLQPATRKLLQYQNLEADIRGVLPLKCVHRYFLFPIAAEQEGPYSAAKFGALLSTIDSLLATTMPS